MVILDATKILKDYQKNFRINLRATSASREKGWLRKQATPYIAGQMKEGEVRKYVRFHKVAPKFE